MIPGGLHSMIGKRLIAYDNFSEADNTVINGKALDVGGTWASFRTINTPTSKVLSGKATVVGTSAAEFFGCSTFGTPDYIVSGLLTAPGGNGAFYGRIGLVARWDGVNYIANSAGSFIYADLCASIALRIVKFINGVATILVNDTTKNTIIAGNTYQCSLIVNKDIATFITPNGTISATIPNSAYSRAGFYLINNETDTPGFVDNFKVEAP